MSYILCTVRLCLARAVGVPFGKGTGEDYRYRSREPTDCCLSCVAGVVWRSGTGSVCMGFFVVAFFFPGTWLPGCCGRFGLVISQVFTLGCIPYGRGGARGGERFCCKASPASVAEQVVIVHSG